MAKDGEGCLGEPNDGVEGESRRKVVVVGGAFVSTRLVQTSRSRTHLSLTRSRSLFAKEAHLDGNVMKSKFLTQRSDVDMCDGRTNSATVQTALQAALTRPPSAMPRKTKDL